MTRTYFYIAGTLFSRISYKAPHAPQGSPPRPKSGKFKVFRLFKGHRP